MRYKQKNNPVLLFRWRWINGRADNVTGEARRQNIKLWDIKKRARIFLVNLTEMRHTVHKAKGGTKEGSSSGEHECGLKISCQPACWVSCDFDLFHIFALMPVQERKVMLSSKELISGAQVGPHQISQKSGQQRYWCCAD